LKDSIQQVQPNAMPSSGLTSEEVKQRLKSDGFNELPKPQKRNFLKILMDVMREPMFALLIIGGIIYWLLGDTIEAIILLLFASFSVSITLIQESRSERVLDALRDLASPRALVIRNGERKHIAGKEVVRGDLIILNEGDRVAADAHLIAASDLLLDESLLTGESVPASKLSTSVEPNTMAALPGSENSAAIFAGTLVVRGTGQALVNATGSHTEMGKIGNALGGINIEQAHLQKQLRWFVRDFAIIGFVLSVLAILLYGFLRDSWLQAILGGIALGMSLLPEEFPLVMAVFMAMGAWRISQARVLTRRASAIETLGATTVLCTDKTGTLTENRMTLMTIIGEQTNWQQTSNKPLSHVETSILDAALLACPLEPSDPMDIAVHALANIQDRGNISARKNNKIVHAYGLRPDLFATTNIVNQVDDENLFAFSKGALEAIIKLCNLSDSKRDSLIQQANAMASQGIRVLAVAKANLATIDAKNLPDSPKTFSFEYLGLLGFADPLRANVAGAVAECSSAGIRVVMITGDYPITAKAIAEQAGIVSPDVLSGDELEILTDEQLALRVKTTSIFARIRPNQKLRIVQSFKNNGAIVAMTGDGVNDAPAIKAAHIGIAMGGRGTDVAREASAIVLLDDDFGSIVKTIRLGRRIYDNLRKAIEYIIAVHIPIAGLAILPLLTGLPLMLTPIHIAFLEMVIDPACSVVFEAEQEESDVMKRPARDPKSPLLTSRRIWWGVVQGLVAFILLGAIMIGGARLNMAEDDLRTLVFSSLVLVNMGLILINRSFTASLIRAFIRPNRSLWILLSVVSFLLGVAVLWPPAQHLFHFGSFHANQFAVCIAASLLSLITLEAIKAKWFRIL
jgi:Ca2+-transporting ATPase